MSLLVVDPDGKFKIFKNNPQRCVQELTKEADYLEEDYHGHFYRPKVPTNEFKEFWGCPYYPPHSSYIFYDEGIEINKKFLSNELQNLTWNDEPFKID